LVRARGRFRLRAPQKLRNGHWPRQCRLTAEGALRPEGAIRTRAKPGSRRHGVDPDPVDGERCARVDAVMNTLATQPTTALPGATARGVGWLHRWRLRLVHILPLAALYGLAVGIKDSPLHANWESPGRFLLETFAGELFGGAFLFTLVAAVDASEIEGRARTLAYAVATVAAAAISLGIVQFLFVWLGVWSSPPWSMPVTFWANFGKSLVECGLAVVLYRLWQRDRARASTLRGIRFERADVLRRTTESQLQAMQARIDPAFLFDTMTAIERTYEHDAATGDRLLDDLITYLRAALPEMLNTTSTLGRETDLARAYLDIGRVRYGVDLSFEIVVPEALRDARFPPMILLPLVDHALNSVRSAESARIRIESREASGVVEVWIDMSPITARSHETPERVRMRLRDLYGERAALTLARGADAGERISVEIPHAEAASADR
ncbi:MAG: histidine kinase, partial [Betaproteobacteria bacterium]